MSTYSQAYKGYIADVPRLWFKRACDSKVFYFDHLTAASVTPNTEFTEVNAGWSLHPKAYIPGQSTLEMQITSGEFNTDLFAMGSKKAPKFHYATQNSEVYEGFSPCCDVDAASGDKLNPTKVTLKYPKFTYFGKSYTNSFQYAASSDLRTKYLDKNKDTVKVNTSGSSMRQQYSSLSLYFSNLQTSIEFNNVDKMVDVFPGSPRFLYQINNNGIITFARVSNRTKIQVQNGSIELPSDYMENTQILIPSYYPGEHYTQNGSTITIVNKAKTPEIPDGTMLAIFYLQNGVSIESLMNETDSYVLYDDPDAELNTVITYEIPIALSNGGLLPTGVIQPTAGSFYCFPVSDNNVTLVFNEADINGDWVTQGEDGNPYGEITLTVENQDVYRAYKTEHLAAAVSSYGTNKTSVSISEAAGEEWRITVSGLKNMYSEAGEPSIDNITTFVPPQGYFLPWGGSANGSWTLLFNPADVAATKEVEVTYEIAVDGAIEYQFDNKEFVTGEALLRWPIYGKADDCTDAGIKGYVDLKVYKARITQMPGMDTSYKSASTWQFTLSAMNPKRSDGSVYKIAYYGADVHHDDSPEAIEGYIGYGTLRSSDGVTVGSSPITVGPNTTINVTPLTQNGHVFSTDHPGATYMLEKEDNSEWVTVTTISDPQDETISFSVTDSATYRVKALFDREGQRPADMTSTQTFTVNVAPRETNGLYRTITGSGITPSFLRGTYDAGTVKGEILKSTTVRTSSKKSFTFGAQSAADGSIDIYKKEPSASTWTKLATVDQTYTIAANKYADSGTQYVLIGHDAPMESGLLTVNTY